MQIIRKQCQAFRWTSMTCLVMVLGSFVTHVSAQEAPINFPNRPISVQSIDLVEPEIGMKASWDDVLGTGSAESNMSDRQPLYPSPHKVRPMLFEARTLPNGRLEFYLSRPIRLGVQADFLQSDMGVSIAPTLRRLQQVFGSQNIQVIEFTDAKAQLEFPKGGFDFVIADSVFFSRYENEQHLIPIASIWPKEAASPERALGTVFITRSDNRKVTKETDFINQQIGALSPTSAGGYLIGLHELYKQGLLVDAVKSRVHFFGDNPLDVFEAVRTRQIGVGMIPTCIYEYYVENQKIEGSDFKVIGSKDSDLIACRTSTSLYPGQYFISFPDTNSSLTKAVSAVLFTVVGRRTGLEWGLPVSNREIYDLFFDLKIERYAPTSSQKINAVDVENNTAVSAFLAISLLIMVYAATLAVLVRRRTQQLATALQERKEIEKIVNDSRDHIANLERTGIVGQMSTMIAHELKQPLGAITNFANGLLRRTQRGTLDEKVLQEVLAEIVEQGTRASEIVDRVRTYAKRQTPDLVRMNMSEVIDRAIVAFRRSGRTQALINCHFGNELWAEIDDWEIELALLNLLKNAADALEGVEDPCIELTTEPYERFWRISVKDNGKPITQAQVDHFMMPLVTTKKHGLGLGISIVSNIAERHHGRVIGIANPDRGVTICLDIPRAADSQNLNSRDMADIDFG